MCRSQSEVGEGRRCACDSSTARFQRRSNAKLKEEFSHEAVNPSDPRMSSADVHRDVTVEDTRKAIDKLNELLGNTNSAHEEIDAAVMFVGAHVATLAEEQFGCPKDEDFEQAIVDADFGRQREHTAEMNRLRKKFDALYDEFCEELGLDHEEMSFVRFTRVEELVSHGLSTEDADSLRAIKAQYEQELRKKVIALTVGNQDKYHEIKTDLLLKRNDSIRRTLEAVGVTMANPESLVYDEKSNARAVKAVKSALPFFPQAWVEESNKGTSSTPLLLKASSARAHYKSSAQQHTRSIVPIRDLIYRENSWKPDAGSKAELELTRLIPNEQNRYIDPDTGKDLTEEVSLSAHYGTDSSIWVRQIYEYRAHREGNKPKGRGWEEISFTMKVHSRESGWSDETVKQWRQPKKMATGQQSRTTSEVTINFDKVETSDTLGHRVALHEMTHRFEHTVPKLARAEHAFLERRRGGGTDSPEQLQKIYPNSDDPKKHKEEGYPDNFINRYMGRVYSGSSYFEIMSMGMESLFAGTNNGLAESAFSIQKADADYRKFILGALTIRPS